MEKKGRIAGKTLRLVNAQPYVSQLKRFLFTYQLRLYHYESCESYSEDEAESIF